MEAVLVVVGEPELLGVDAVVVEGGDDGTRRGAGLHHADALIGDEGVRRPARDQVVGMDLPEADRRRLGVLRRLLDAAGDLGDHELDVERIHARGGLVRAGDANRVRRRLVVRRAHEHLVEAEAAVRADLLARQLPDLAEHALVVGDRDRDLARAVADDDRARGDGIEHGGGQAVVAVAAPEVDAVPATVGRADPAVGRGSRAVEEGLRAAGGGIAVVAAVVVQVLVGLLEREQVRTVERAGGVAVCRVGGGGRGERRCDVDHRCPDDEASRSPGAGPGDGEGGDHDGGACGGHAWVYVQGFAAVNDCLTLDWPVS